jgi:hypothetical protein
MDSRADVNRWQIGDVRITGFSKWKTLSKGTFVWSGTTLENIQQRTNGCGPISLTRTARVRTSVYAL